MPKRLTIISLLTVSSALPAKITLVIFVPAARHALASPFKGRHAANSNSLHYSAARGTVQLSNTSRTFDARSLKLNGFVMSWTPLSSRP